MTDYILTFITVHLIISFCYYFYLLANNHQTHILLKLIRAICWTYFFAMYIQKINYKKLWEDVKYDE